MRVRRETKRQREKRKKYVVSTKIGQSDNDEEATQLIRDPRGDDI